MAQLVKNLPAMQETWVPSLDWEDPLEEGMATHSKHPGLVALKHVGPFLDQESNPCILP